MISQVMESRSPVQFAQPDFSSKCIAFDEIIEVKGSSNASPYYSFESVHCDLLDIAEVVTVADCVSSDDISDMCGDLNITKTIPESKTCFNTHTSSRDLVVSETNCGEVSYETSMACNGNDVPFEQESGREILSPASGDPCGTNISTSGNLFEVDISSSDSSTLPSLYTTTEVIDDENCSQTDCGMISTSDICQRKNNSKENYLSSNFVVEISSIIGNKVDVFSQCNGSMKHTIQSCEVSQRLCCMTTGDPLILPTLHLGPHVADDDIKIPSCHASFFDSSTVHRLIAQKPQIPPCPVLESRDIGTVSNKDYLVMCCEGIKGEFYTDSMLEVQSVSESGNTGIKTKMKNAVASFHTGLRNECDAGFKFNAMVAENHLSQPSSLVGPLETETESREKNDISLCTNIFHTDHSSNSKSKELLHFPGVDLYKIENEAQMSVEKLPPYTSIMSGYDASDKFVYSVVRSSGKVEEPDFELTKHLIQGLSFITPVRDFIKSHRLFGQHSIKYAESLEDKQIFGFDELGCNGNSQICSVGTNLSAMNVDLVEEHCGHFQLGSSHTIHQDENISVNSKKKCITFGSITIYYFHRAQGFAAISSDGGVALGMEQRHCDVRLHSVLDYATHKHQLQLKSLHRKRKKKQLTYSSSDDYKGQKPVQTLSSRRRASLLRAAGIRNIDHIAIQEAVMINASRLACGCCCVDNCLPDTCVCARLEIECLVPCLSCHSVCKIDLDGFPCKCSAEKCSNPYGRTKFSPTKVRSHIVHTLMQLEKEEVSGEDISANPASQKDDWIQESMPSSGACFKSSVVPHTHMGTSPTSIVELTHNVWM